MKTKKRLLSILLTLALLLGLMPGMSLTAYAAEQKVTFTAGGTNNGITVSPTFYSSKFGAFFVDNSGENVSISSSNYNITKLVLTDKKLYGDQWGDSYLGASAGNVSFSGDTMTVTGINAKTVTIQGNSSDYATIGSIDVYYSTHTHSFTYSADGATITATCTADGCTLPESSAGAGDHVATLTIGAPELTTYGGTESAAATIDDTNSIQGGAKVQYQKKTGESTYDTATETAPTDAGTYKASITLGEATASVEYTIAKAAETAPADAAAALAQLTISYPEETVSAKSGYEVAADNSGTAISNFSAILDNSTPTVYVRKTATDANHDPSAWVAVTLASRPAAPIGLTAEPPSGTADGKIVGTTADMEYKLKDSTGDWTTASASETSVAAGTYLVRTKATDTMPAGKTTEVAVITAAQNVTNLIDALPAAENVTTADKDAIEAARAAYDALGDDEKANFNADLKAKLEAVEVALLAAQVEALPAANAVTTTDKTAIEAARAKYNALTDTQKATVSTDTLAKLGAVEAALAIAELPEASAVTTANKTAIEAARTAYDALSAEQKTAVGDTAKAKLEAAEAALAIVELPTASNVTADNKDAINAARAKYNALSDTQKTQVGDTNKAKLEATEAALAIVELPTASNVTADNKTAIEAARAAYNALSDTQKTQVGDTLKAKLEADEASLLRIQIEALPAADAVTTGDKDAIEATRTAYDKLTDNQKTAVGAEAKAKLEADEAALAIAGLPAAGTVTEENRTAIEAARAKYDALTDDQKTQVGSDALAKLETDEAALAIAGLPAADAVTTDDKDAIEAARAAYNALSDAQKALVSADTLKKLTDAEDALAAATVSATIDALPAAADVTTANKEAIEAARAAYNALSDSQKALVSADTLQKLANAETALANAQTAATVSDTINALPAADAVTTADKDAIEAARAAYDALSDDQKALVSADTLSKLTDAEDALSDAMVAEVSDIINALPAAADVKASDRDAIKAAHAAYNALTDAEKRNVPKEMRDKLREVETALWAVQVEESEKPVYNGGTQELVTPGIATGGTMYYALGEDGTTAPDFYLDEEKTQVNTEKWSTSVPTGTATGTYYVWYMVKGDENHNDTKPACVTVEIKKKELTVTADAKSKTVGEADPELTYTVTGLVGTDVMSGALSREAGETAGTYAITQGTLTAGDNYVITYTPAVLTIKEAPSSGGGGGGGVYYGGGTVSSQTREAYGDVIGASVTSFRDASPERVHNVELACEKLNGIIVQPGETFSFNETVGVFTAEAGFEVAPVDPGDEATAEMGGGVSQVASTLYAGSLLAMLEPVERTNHAFPVSFIQPGTDALVTNPTEGEGHDLQFRNNRSEPVKIVATCKANELTNTREIRVEILSALGTSDYMPILFDNTWSGNSSSVPVSAIDYTRPGYRIVLDHEEQSFTDANGSGIRTLTHRKILDANGWLVKDEILNARLSDGSYAMDTYYTKG